MAETKFTELLHEDKQWVLTRLPGVVKDLMVHYGTNVFVAGGFIRACIANEEPNDIDLFVDSKSRADSVVTFLTNAEPEGVTYETANAITFKSPKLKYPIQIIHRWVFDKPIDAIKSFDFTIAQAALFCGGTSEFFDETRALWLTVVNDRFYADLSAKRLIYTSPFRNEDAGGSLLRVLKFYQKGYRIPLPSLGAVLARIDMAVDRDVLKPIGTPQTKEQLEERIALVYTGLLREVDPNTPID